MLGWYGANAFRARRRAPAGANLPSMDDRGSRTARMVARFRALGADAYGDLVIDRWAAAFADATAIADAERYLAVHPHGVLYLALRTVTLDDEVRRAVREGVRQIVILGAGLDTRAARLASPGVRFFEVDHPATQDDKRARLRSAAGYPLDAATFVPCDFERDDFLERLASAGHVAGEPSLVLWEGVVYYLTEAAVRATCTRIARDLHPSTRLVLDLVGKRFARGELRDPNDQRARDLVSEMGEPIRFGIDDPLPLLYECGFRCVDVRSFDELALRYTGTYERDRKMRFQSMVSASASAPPRE
jgi:methyltransferase (TIGR00027 family)